MNGRVLKKLDTILNFHDTKPSFTGKAESKSDYV